MQAAVHASVRAAPAAAPLAAHRILAGARPAAGLARARTPSPPARHTVRSLIGQQGMEVGPQTAVMLELRCVRCSASCWAGARPGPGPPAGHAVRGRAQDEQGMWAARLATCCLPGERTLVSTGIC